MLIVVITYLIASTNFHHFLNIRRLFLFPSCGGEVRGEAFSSALCLQSATALHPSYGILFNGIADVEGTFGLDEAYVGTLPESDAVHYIVRFIIHQF